MESKLIGSVVEDNDICDNEKSLLRGEGCLYLYNKDRGCNKCPMIQNVKRRFYPT